MLKSSYPNLSYFFVFNYMKLKKKHFAELKMLNVIQERLRYNYVILKKVELNRISF